MGLAGQILVFYSQILGLGMIGFGVHFLGLGFDRLGQRVGESDLWGWGVALGHRGSSLGIRGG